MSDIGRKNSDTDWTESFLKLSTPIQGKLFAFILTHWPNRDDAEDILQQTMATMWRKYGDYQKGTDFQAWAITIAKYTFMSFRKKKASNPIHFNDEVLQILDSRSNEFINKHETRLVALKDCLEKLDKKRMDLIEQKYYKQVPVKRIAVRYGTSPRAVYKAIAGIHNVLMRCVKRALGDRVVYE